MADRSGGPGAAAMGGVVTSDPSMSDPSTPGPSVSGAAEDGVVVAVMQRGHLSEVTAIEAESNTHPWPHSLFLGELRMPTSRHWLVALEADRVVGFAGLMWTLDEGHITNFAVAGEHRRRQVATRMLLAQFRDAARLGVVDVSLEVRMSNLIAQDLYSGFGFVPAGVRRDYYNDNGEDALIMWCHDITGDDQLARLASIESSLKAPLRRDPA
ncbi:MAG: ribosomal protein S18-alanine N-acetyltransferase [Microthrixaceae bacterium]